MNLVINYQCCPTCGVVVHIYGEGETASKLAQTVHDVWHKQLDERIRSAASVGMSGDRAAQMSQPLGG